MKISKQRLTIIFSLALIVSIALTTTAYAIKYGQPDGDAHPYVCWIISYPGSGPWYYLGSGSLIDPDVVLTAGHVADIGDPNAGAFAFVSFKSNPQFPLGGPDWISVESWETHEDYALEEGTKGLTDWITHDVGVLILIENVASIECANLPSPDLVDTLSMKQDVDLVGYGVQFQWRGLGVPPPDNWDWDDWPPFRYNATAQLIACEGVLSDEFIKITANPAKGKGGTCFGDSGSPILLAGTDTVLGVCSWGTNGNCAGIGYQQRIDTSDILSWLNTFLD